MDAADSINTKRKKNEEAARPMQLPGCMLDVDTSAVAIAMSMKTCATALHINYHAAIARSLKLFASSKDMGRSVKPDGASLANSTA